MDGRELRGSPRGRRGERIVREVLSSDLHTRFFAKEFASHLRPGDVICLEGNLGAGKTSFVKGIAEFFGWDGTLINSPTFVYLNLYDPIAHFDLYRLKNEEQFLSMGFDEYFTAPYITCVEWPNILDKALPKEVFWIKLEHCEGGRMVEIEKRVSL
jgi:tRNA threonylcarbamoyladenosine biosynthesis protein TsaE